VYMVHASNGGWGGVEATAGFAAALAVVGLGQVDEIEEEGEGARKLVGGGVGERLHAVGRVLQVLPHPASETVPSAR